jgi:hypothetical protein
MIEFEERTGVRYLDAVTQVVDGEVSAKTALGISFVLARRDNKKLSWKKHLAASSAEALGPLLTFGPADEDDEVEVDSSSE